jgi:magnesium transporter
LSTGWPCATLGLDVVTCRLYRSGKLAKDGFDPARVSDHLEEPDSLVWLDLEDPTEEELAMIEEEFALHPLALEDARHRGQRPKVDVYEKYFFLVMHAVQLKDGELQDQEVHAFVGPSYLVTLRYAPAFDLEPVLRRWEQQQELTKEGGGFLLYALLDEVVDGYFDVAERFEDVSEDIEEQVFGEKVPADIQERIFQLKKQVIEFRRLVMPLREVLDLIQEEPRVVTSALNAYYRDVADHVIRTLEFIESVRDLLTTALQAHASQVGNRLNVVMKQLTSWAGIILVPTLIAGIFGMNFRHMPELNWRLGYPLALGLMAVSAFTLYTVFKRRGWL